MKYVVLGKNVHHNWKLDDGMVSTKKNGEITKTFVSKPQITEEIQKTAYPEILQFEGELKFNNNYGLFSLSNEFNISEEETVRVDRMVFRADLNKTFVYTDKVIEETDNKEEAEAALAKQLKEFNKTMIKSNPKMQQYCDLHRLSYVNTDCIELFKLLFPNECYEIVDGEMRVAHMIATATASHTHCLDTTITSDLINYPLVGTITSAY